MNVALLIMFVVRPVADLTFGTLPASHTPESPTFNSALLVGLVGSAAFQVGYFSKWGRRLAGGGRLLRQPFEANYLSKWGLSLAVVGIGLYGAFLVRNGGVETLMSLLAGRQQSHAELFRNSTAYLYQARLLLIPATVMLLAAARIRRARKPALLGVLVSLPLLIIAGATGSRVILLPLLGAGVCFWYLSAGTGLETRGRRPGVGALVIVAFLVLAVGLNVIRMTRNAGPDDVDAPQQVVQLLTSPVLGARLLLTSGDTRMFDSLNHVMEAVPEQLAFQHGAVVRDLAIRAVPRTVWPDKPPESNAMVLRHLNETRFERTYAGTAFSIIGYLYLGSGYVSVGLGMMAIGVGLSALWHTYVRNSDAVGMQMVYAACLPFIIVLARGTIPGTVSRGVFVMLPILALAVAAKKARTLGGATAGARAS
jgi:hypothetical protein